MRNWIVAMTVVAVSLLSSSVAFAQTGYICDVYLLPQENSGYGVAGLVGLGVYTRPFCQGSFVRMAYYCSDGATSESCPVRATYTLSEAQLNALYQNSVAAAQQGTQISFSTTTCNGGATDCPSHLFFSGRP